MIFNGHDLSQYFLIESPSRAIMPEVELTTQDVSGMDGTQFVSSRLKPRSISFKVLLRPLGLSVTEVSRRLAPILLTDEPVRLILDEEPGKYYLAMLDGTTDLDSLWRPGGSTITFKCMDPVAYGVTERSLSSTTTKLALEVGGTYRTWPKVSVTPGNQSYYRVTRYDTGEYVQLNYSFTGSNALVIDMESMHCTIDGASADQYVTLDSDFFSLDPGVADIRSSSSNATIEWVERWL